MNVSIESPLTIALSKGRIFKDTLPLLGQAGIEPLDDPDTSRDQGLFLNGALLVQEAGGVVSDIAGGSQHLQTGNVICANIKLHGEMAKTIRKHLPGDLSA